MEFSLETWSRQPQMSNDLNRTSISLVTAFLHGNQQPGWDEVGTLPPSQVRGTRCERLLPAVGVWLVCLLA